MAGERINQIIQLLEKEFPGTNPKPGKANPLDVLIATMLSQNTTDKTSFKAYMNLRRDIGSWEDVMNSPLPKIRKAIKVCGLANQKSVSIKKLLSRLKKEKGKLSLSYLKKMSDDEIYADLQRYDGVGVKTITCVLAFALGRDVFPVDTHVHRLMNRLGIVKTKMPDKTFGLAKEIVPQGSKFLLHTLLIKYGRKICRAQNPLCGKCVLYDICEFDEKENYVTIAGQTSPKENNFIILEHIA